jgi:hypothetical protein
MSMGTFLVFQKTGTRLVWNNIGSRGDRARHVPVF